MRVIARMNVGGPAMQVAGLAEFLPSDEFDQILVTGAVSSNEADFTELYGLDLPLVRLASTGRGFGSITESAVVFDLIKKIRRFRPHLIHSHTAKAGVLARVASTLSGVPSIRVHTYHGHLLTGYFSPVALSTVVSTEKLLARQTDRLVTVGTQVRDELLLKGVGRPDQYRVIPPGLARVEVTERRQARSKLGLTTEQFVILFMGRLTKVKRVDRLLAAVSLVSPNVPNLRVLIAGDGELRAHLEAQAKAMRLPVDFLGWRRDIGTLLGAADCVVMTSDNEGTPISLIQAAQAGVAVVATDVGSVAEVVDNGETGILTAATAEAVAEALVRLAHDLELCKQLGKRGRALALDRYSYQRLAHDHADLYREMMEKAR